MNIARSFVELAVLLSERRRSELSPASDAGTHEIASGASPTHGTRFDNRSLRRRARLRGWKLPITDGPFAESKEL